MKIGFWTAAKEIVKLGAELLKSARRKRKSKSKKEADKWRRQ